MISTRRSPCLRRSRHLVVALASLFGCSQRLAPASPPSGPAAPLAPAAPPAPPASWKDRSASPAERTARLLRAMTQEEKLVLVTGFFGIQKFWNDYRFPEARPQSAGFVPGVPRLGFTPQWQCDAGSGVATQGESPPALERTLLPSVILTA